MKMFLGVLMGLMLSFSVHAEILWGKPRVAPYTGTPALALGLMKPLLPTPVLGRLLIMAETKRGCTRTVAFPGLQLTAMMSGADKLLPNVRVGDWPQTMPDLPAGAWRCHVHSQGVDYYIIIFDVCNNISLVIMRDGVCIPNPNVCDRDCETYARAYVS